MINIIKLTIFSLFLLFSFSMAIDNNFYVQDIKGRGQFKLSEDAAWQTLIRKSSLPVGSFVRSGPNSLITMRFANKGMVIIKETTYMHFKKLRQNEKDYIFLYLYSGKMRIISGTSDIFKIESKNANALLESGDLVVYYKKGQSYFYQFKGNSKINDLFNRGTVVILNKKESVNFDSKMIPSKKGIIPQGVYREWDLNINMLEREEKPILLNKHNDLNLSDGPGYTFVPQTNKLPKNISTTNESAVVSQPNDGETDELEFKIKHKLKAGYFHEPENDVGSSYGYTLKLKSKSYSNFGHWISLVYMPEISYGSVSVGLYLPFYVGFREQFYLARNFYNWDDYNFDRSTGDWVDDLINKIIYLKFKYRNLTFKIGGFDNMTYGSGFLLNEYSTLLEFPYKRVNGFSVTFEKEIKGITFNYFNGGLGLGILSALRFQLNPFITFNQTKNPFLKKISIATSLVLEDDPVKKDITNSHPLYLYATNKNSSVTGYGADIIFPLSGKLANSIMYINAGLLAFRQPFTNMSHLTKYGPGYSVGMKGNISTVIYRAELYYNTKGFIAEYFNTYHYYDLKRADALSSLLNQQRSVNVGWLIAGGVDLQDTGKITVTFSEYFRPMSKNNPTYRFVRNNLMIKASIDEGVNDRYYGDLYYYKEHIIGKRFFKDFLKDAVVGAEVHVQIIKSAELIIYYLLSFNDVGEKSSSFSFDFAFDLDQLVK